MLIIGGSYEGGIVGLDVPLPSDTSQTQAPTDDSLSFRFICSQGSIRCLALGADYLCCGGTDETVQIYGLNNRKKHGDLLLSEGCITAVSASGTMSKGLILVGNEYGGIKVFDSRTLELVKQLKGGKKAITSVSVHPNGESALTVSEGATLRLWDLKTFLCVFYSKLNEPSLKVEWNFSGEDYYILSENQLLRLSLNDSKKPQLYKAPPGIKHTCATWLGSGVAVGCKSGDMLIYSDADETGAIIKQVHSKRIKSIASLKEFVITSDYDGVIKCSSAICNEGTISLKEHWQYNVGMHVNTIICRETA